MTLRSTPSCRACWGCGDLVVLPGAIGYRGADEGRLFLENYLAAPVEDLIGLRAARPVARGEIVEVGNLAGIHCRAACRLVAALPPLLLSQGRRWIVFTATDTVRTVLTRLGAPLVELASARAAQAPAGRPVGPLLRARSTRDAGFPSRRPATSRASADGVAAPRPSPRHHPRPSLSKMARGNLTYGGLADAVQQEAAWLRAQPCRAVCVVGRERLLAGQSRTSPCSNRRSSTCRCPRSSRRARSCTRLTMQTWITCSRIAPTHSSRPIHSSVAATCRRAAILHCCSGRATARSASWQPRW